MLRQAIRLILAAVLLTVAPAVGVAQEAVPDFTPKSPALATGLSLLGTVGPTALGLLNPGGSGAGWLIAYGIYVGPSTGYFYAGRSGHAIGGAGMRLGFSALTALGIAGACGGNVWGCEDEEMANVVALVGLGLVGLSAVYDIVGAGSAAREWNARHQPPRLSFTPQINPVARSGGLVAHFEF